MYSHFDRVFLMIVDKGYGLVVSLDAINCHARLALPAGRLQDGDVVDSLSIPVVHCERLPIRRDARSETQLIHLKPQSQE